MGNDTAAIDIARQNYGDVCGARETHIGNVVFAQIDFCCAPCAFDKDNAELTLSEGMMTSLLSEYASVALATSAWAILTEVLLRCAKSTTVASETCAVRHAGTATSAQLIESLARVRRLIAVVNSVCLVRT